MKYVTLLSRTDAATVLVVRACQIRSDFTAFGLLSIVCL